MEHEAWGTKNTTAADDCRNVALRKQLENGGFSLVDRVVSFCMCYHLAVSIKSLDHSCGPYFSTERFSDQLIQFGKSAPNENSFFKIICKKRIRIPRIYSFRNLQTDEMGLLGEREAILFR